MCNVQQRLLPVPLERAATVVDDLADDALSAWPSASWPRLRLDAGLVPGSRGGHGPIRYTVTAYEPGRRLLMTFDPAASLDGWHELRLDLGPGGRTTVVHTIQARTRGRMRWRWPLVVRWLHEALIQDLFDRAQALTSSPPARPARWSPWVRVLRRAATRPQDDQAGRATHS